MIEKLITPEEWPSQALVLPRLQAHRGYWLGGAQENSINAFQAAKTKGALMFECDLRLSKDQIPVVFHDEDLQRISGRPDRVSDLTAAELKQFAQVPTLREILTDPSVPRFANLELKSKEKLDDPLERKVADVVKQVKAQSRVLFSSFNPMSLYRMSLHLPDVPRALLVTQENDPENPIFLKKMWLAPLIRIHLLHLDHKMVTEQSMKLWNQQRMPVAVWTVNGKEEIQKYQRLGVISIISDSL
ncbi:MAG: glycerophosphodiester phosphodiesterase [Pseudobdellovibrionaceae bacterium]